MRNPYTRFSPIAARRFDRVGEPLPHRDRNGVLFLWDDQTQGPFPPYAPPGTRIDPYGNIIHDEPAVTPFEPGPPATPPLPSRPPIDVRVPRGPRDLGGFYPQRDPITRRIPGAEQIPGPPSPGAERVPRPPGPPAPPTEPSGEQTPRPRGPAPPAPPRTPPLGPYGTGEPQLPPTPPGRPPLGPYGAGEPLPATGERPPLNILKSIGTFALLTAPAWATFIVLRTRRP